MTEPVNVECTAIPDGVIDRPEGRMLRVSVVLAPAPDANGPISLLDWPTEIPRLKFEVRFGAGIDSLGDPLAATVEFDPAGAPAGIESAAQAFWSKTWQDDQVRAAYWQALGGTPLPVAGGPAPLEARPAPTKIDTYAYTQLAELARERLESGVEIGLLSAAYHRQKGRGAAEAGSAFDTSSLSPLARARLENPNDPTVLLADAQELMRRSLFFDLPVGDGIDAAISGAMPAGSALGLGAGTETAAIIPHVDRQIQASAAAILKARAVRTDPNVAADNGEPTAAWAPFVPAPSEISAEAGSTERIARLFESRYDRGRFGKPVDAPKASVIGNGEVAAEAAPDPAPDDIRKAITSYDRAMRTDEELGVKNPTDPNTETPQQIAARHAAAFQAHPTLRKFVKLIVDVFVPYHSVPADLLAAKRGVVTVRVVGTAASSRASVTAFEVLQTEDGGPLFEPAPEAGFGGHPGVSLVPSLPLFRGVVRLSIGLQSAVPGAANYQPRFRLELLDALASIASLRRSLQVAMGASRNGLPADRTFYDEPGLRTRGLMLLDLEATVPFNISEARKAEVRKEREEAAAAGAPAAVRLYYAEDLVDGYRLDVVAPNGDVFPAGSRQLRYSSIPGSLGKDNPYAEVEARDEGYIAPGGRSWTGQDEEGKPQRNLLVSEQLLCWTGDNIGLPAHADGRTPDRPPPTDRLPGTIHYQVSSALGPILRVGGRYRYMLRARKLNGSSVSVQQSHALAPSFAVGDPGNDSGYLFAPVEKAPVPIVLVGGDELLNLPALGDNQPASEIMLVAQDQPMRRFLVLPRAGFDLAEQQGQFDHLPLHPGENNASAEARADRAAEFGCYRMLDRDDAGYFRKKPSGGAIGSVADNREVDAALLFKLQALPPKPPASRYFVDSSLKYLAARLVPTKATPTVAIDPAAATGEVSFWKDDPLASPSMQGFTQDGVRPILLEVVGARPDELSRIEVLRDDTIVKDSGRTLAVPTLRIHVGAGDTLEIEVWLNRTTPHLLANSMVRNAMGRTLAMLMGTRNGDPGAPDHKTQEFWAELRRHRRISMLHDVLRIRVEQGVRKPLGKPSFRTIKCVHAVGVANWNEISTKPDKRETPEADSLFNWGKVEFDRKTTGILWAEAFWREDDPARMRQRTLVAEVNDEIDQGNLWSYSPKPDSGRLFTIDPVASVPAKSGEDPEDYAVRANTIDLVRDEAGGQRALAAEFQCHKARRLLVRLVARSRFAPPASDLESMEYIEESASREACIEAITDGRLQATKWDGASPVPGTMIVWLLATRRPPPPKLMKDRGSIYQRRLRPDNRGVPAGQQGQTLSHAYRLWLGDDWFASGEDEQLAIVCMDRAKGTQADWLQSQLSRWGGDMTMEPSQLLRPPGADGFDPSFLDPTQILDAQFADEALPDLEEPGGDPLTATPLGVKLALLTPLFHPGTGRWYCDIELADAPAFRLTVKLSVARYQPHALPGYKLSEPVMADAFVLHQPWTFAAARAGGFVEVSAIGPAYVSRAPMTMGLDNLAGADVAIRANIPLIVAELERLVGANKGPLPVAGPQNDRLAIDNMVAGTRPDLGYGSNPSQALPPGCTRWRMRLPLPASSDDGLYAVRISLATAHANSLAAIPDLQALDGAFIYLPEPVTVVLPI